MNSTLSINGQESKENGILYPSGVMLDISKLKKTYPGNGTEYVVLEDLDLQIMKQEFVTIIGHSGCGKTTLLSMIAGLNPISGGNIAILGHAVKGPGPDRGVIFQSPSLMPWMTALQNVLLGVNRVFPHASKAERGEIARYYLQKVGLEGAFDKKAGELSQGMQQRVGIARAFAIRPSVLLLDEPFGMLDSLTRGELQDILIEIWNREKITAVMITHDVDEAIFLADRVVMMTSGPRARIGDVLNIDFERPRSRKAVLEHENYYHYRKYLIDFLEH